MNDEEIKEVLDTIRILAPRFYPVDSAAPDKVWRKGEEGVHVTIEHMSHITIPRKLAKTILGILESDYYGTDIYQDEINELKGLL